MTRVRRSRASSATLQVDTQDCRIAVADDGRGDRSQGALQGAGALQVRLGRVQSLLADSGYVGQPFAQGAGPPLADM